ncbi:hypothetical protein [Erwinia sp. E_sp_B04_7]|uniref:hypothetical protein n=1 Tax=unclassified Erwinia TaxID=2622719 RepID=UPI0030CD0550
MNFTEHEMRGVIKGQALPADISFGESVPAYLVRKFAEVVAERDRLQEQVKALAGEQNWWKPERCPVTNRPFFLWIEHPNVGMVPTYGGPYDSYTIPEVDNDGEFSCERFDHDEGGWVDGVCLSIRLIDDQQQVVDEDFIAEIKAQGVEGFASAVQGGHPEGDRAIDLARHYAAQLRAKPAEAGDE